MAVALLAIVAVVAPAAAQALSASQEFNHEPVLVVEHAQWLLGGEQLRLQESVVHSDPLAVAAREGSARRFEGLGARGAARLARASFPTLVDHVNGGIPQLPSRDKFEHLIDGNLASVKLPGGKRGVLETTSPMGVGSGSHYKPINLHLRAEGSKFVPSLPAAGVDLAIPRTLSSGVSLAGMSMTPVDSTGRALSSASGTIEGASVFYGDSEGVGARDMDTLVKPETRGYGEETILRSEASPSELFYKIGLPKGAQLSQPFENGPVLVSKAGMQLAAIRAPRAIDAEGQEIPLSTKISGSTLEVSFQREGNQYRFPIAVDPYWEIGDYQMWATGTKYSNWHYVSNGPNFTGYEAYGRGWVATIGGYHSAAEYGSFVYTTQGASAITELWMKGDWYDPGARFYNIIQMAGWGGVENYEILPESWTGGLSMSWHICAYECKGSNNNTAYWAQESYEAGVGSGGTNELNEASVIIQQSAGPSVILDTTDPEIYGKPNALYGSNWLGPGTDIAYWVTDPGTGVARYSTYYENPTKYPYWVEISHYKPIEENLCSGVQCPPVVGQPIYYNSAMADGEQVHIQVDGSNNFNEGGSGEHIVKVDGTPPHGIIISGLPANHQLDFTHYTLKAEASDGAGTTPSSGIKSIALTVDGQQIGSSAGSCTPGPCTAHSESWTVDGNEFGGGEHLLEVTATDYAGNVAKEKIFLSVPVAHPIAFGPGEVTQHSGDYQLEFTDVSQGEGLTLSRSYDSQELTEGSDGPLGPQWAMNLGGMEDLEVAANGSVDLTSGSGQKVNFVKGEAGSYISPTGDANLTLSFHEAGSVKEYVLANSAKGTSTKFTLPGGGGTLWVPTIQEGQLPSETTTYSYETVEVAGRKITRPTKALAPVPAGVSCTPTLVAGCRALTFNYATSTTATGETSSGWGDYNGNLTRVYLTYYKPVAKIMETTTIAQYSYDTKGRLRAEWDPRVSPALKTTYGYDSEGHVTALTQSGEETWGFLYGTIAGDTSAGRILKATQAPARAPLWSGAALSNLAAPAISGTTLVGNRLAVSNGSWSETPVLYGYQWEDCNASGAECKPIAGATNPNYTPVATDDGHTLVVQVTAINGDGSVVAVSAASSPVAASQGGGSQIPGAGVSQILGSASLTSVSCVPSTTYCAVSDANGNAYYATTVSSSTPASWHSWTGPGVSPSEALSCPSASECILADGKNSGNGGAIYYASSLGGAWTLKESDTYGAMSLSCPSTSFCFAGSTAAWDRWSNSPSGSWSGQHQTPYAVGNDMDSASCLSSSFCLMGSAEGEVYVANTAAKVESPEWVKTDVDGTTALRGVSCVSTTSCLAVDIHGNLLNLTIASGGTVTVTSHAIDTGNEFTAITCTTNTTCVAVDNHGNAYFSYDNGSTWSLGRGMGDDLTAVSCSTASLCAATDTAGAIQVFDTSQLTEAVDAGNSLNSISCIASSTTCTAADSKGNVFYTTNATGSSKATWHTWTGPGTSPAEAIECFEASLCLLADGSHSGHGGSLYYATSVGGAWAEAYTPSYGVDAISCASKSFCIDGQDGYGYYRYAKTPASASWSLESQGSVAMTAASCAPGTQLCVLGDASGNVHVASTMAQFEAGSAKETKVDSVGIEGISCVTSSACIAVDKSGNVLQILVGEGGTASATVLKVDETGGAFTAVNCTSTICAAVDNKGNAFISTNSGLSWSLSDSFPNGLTSVSCASYSHCFATDTSGNVVSIAGRTIRQGELHSPQPGLTVEYGVPISGASAPHTMTSGEVAKWSQSDKPIEAMAIFPPDEPMGWPASDYRRASVYYFDEAQRKVNVANPAGGISTLEYNEHNDVTRELSSDDRAAALAEGSKSATASLNLDTEDTYSSDGTELLSTLGPKHTVKLSSGEEVSARHHTVFSYDEGAPEGGLYHLVTKMTEGAQLEGGGEQDVQSTVNSYSGQSNLGWRLREPTSVTTDPAGLKLTKTFIYDPSTGNVDEVRNPGSAGEKDPRDTVMVYYTNAANSTYPECGGHPAWANLLCETTPGAQPGTSGLPQMATTTITYGNWLSPQTITQTSGSAFRLWGYIVDGTGRLTETTFTGTQGTSLPSIKYSYESTTGFLNKETTTLESTTKTVTSAHNTLGQLASYTDADGTTSTYEYDADGRVTSVNDGKGQQTYGYSSTSGFETELTDSAVGKISAAYDVEGNLLSETPPDGITTQWTYNPAGEAVGESDTKSSSCGSSCTWFGQTEVPTIHGQTASQTSTLAQAKYAYDEDGRLTEVNETPTGQGCTTRIYGYDAESNMTSLTTREPAAEGKCATSGGVLTSRSFDSGNRLSDAGIKYDAYGDTTVLPAADAGGSELVAGYYRDGQLASVAQAGQTIGYALDPSLRTREVIATGTKSSTTIEHYASEGDSPSWTTDLAGNWTRNISGIGGELIATQTNGEAPTMQLSNLEDDVVGTASSSPTATALLSSTRNTEYGVPTTSTPARYSWLGAAQRPTELPSGIVAMGARGYVPRTGRFLQPDPRVGGSENPYAYANDDPLNESDMSGEYVEAEYVMGILEEMKEWAIEHHIAEEEAAREEAERKAEEAREAAEAAAEATAAAKRAARRPNGKPAAKMSELAMMTDVNKEKQHSCGPGPYKCGAKPGTGTKLIKEKYKASPKEEKEAAEHEAEAAEIEAEEKEQEAQEKAYIEGGGL